jgi:hypothetical protein
VRRPRFVATVAGTLFVAALAVLVSTLALASLAAQAAPVPGVPEHIGQALRDIFGRSSDGPTVAAVNGTPITQRQVDIEVALDSVNGRGPDRAMALQTVITHTVLTLEAERRNLSVSDAELNSFIARQKVVADADPEQGLYRYADALGTDARGIWTYPPVVNSWREQLLIGSLKGQVTADASTVAQKEAVWKSFIADLLARAAITRYGT